LPDLSFLRTAYYHNFKEILNNNDIFGMSTNFMAILPAKMAKK
jgi:hypothetical protein